MTTTVGRSSHSPDNRSYYRRLIPVLEALGSSDGLETLGVHGHTGWYRIRPADRAEQRDDGWSHYARGYNQAADASEFVEKIDRSFYSVLNYQDSAAIMDERRSRYGPNGLNFERGKNPLPGYGDIEALALFADIDLKQRHKDRPLPPEQRELFEEVIEAHVELFGELLGTRECIHVLDSVGGAYVLSAPQATAPIGERFDTRARARVFEELCQRANSWLDSRTTEIYDRLDASHLAKTDCVNNKNRQFKAPLSPHKSIDGVVHPLDTENPRYEFVPIANVTGDLIADTVKWCADFTAPVADAEARVDSLISTLFTEYYV